MDLKNRLETTKDAFILAGSLTGNSPKNKKIVQGDVDQWKMKYKSFLKNPDKRDQIKLFLNYEDEIKPDLIKYDIPTKEYDSLVEELVKYKFSSE